VFALNKLNHSIAQATLIITITPADRVGRFDAFVAGALIVAGSRQPFLDACRVLAAEGVPANTVVTMKHAGSVTACLRGQIGVATGLSVDEARPRFVPWRGDRAPPARKNHPAYAEVAGRAGEHARAEARS
jgi:hypothetical protein